MATATPTNGSYLQHADPQNFPANPTGAPPPNYQNQNPSSSQTTTGTEVPKDEVGWYFVEQYYTTLNKTPDRLHLFYNKRSSFVWGTEGESLPLAHGRPEIQEKISSHEFKDCKVRVSNVDSQASAMNGIVIQVLGEMSNNGLPNRKFSQTFFLAEQPNGYYVLNDIFRYLKDDDDIEEGDEYEYPEEELAEIAAEAVEQVTEEIIEEIQDMSIKETTTVEVDIGEGEKVKVEETHTLEPEIPEATEEVPANGTPEPVNGTSTAPSEPEEIVEEPVAPAEPEAPAEEVVATPPAPVVEEKKPAAPVKEPIVPAVPAAPVRKTWASLVATSAPPPAPAAQAVAAAAAAPSTPAATTPAPQAPATPKASAPSTPTTPGGGSQWQTADNKRHSRINSAVPAGQTLAYVKNVTESVDQATLRNALIKFGPVKSMEINKQKNCAFVEFETPAGFSAANAANPHMLGGSNVLVEPRHVRTANGPYNRGGMTGGRGDGRNLNQGGRGNYQNRDGQRGGRGGPGGTRGNYNSGRGGFRTGTPTN